jgi:uncharacterized protein (TIGR04255 family)
LPRPEHLPDFELPPLVEVVLSVQFASPLQYRDVYAREVWALFEEQFNQVEEQPPLPPQYEVFGGPGPGAVQFKFERMTGPLRNRYWFLAPKGHELIQFQHDRFIHNWRKVGSANSEYPRFEAIREKFQDELTRIDEFYRRKGWGPIRPNQCELTYVNRMPLVLDRPLPPSFYFRKMDVSLVGDATDFVIQLQQTILSKDKGSPIGRLYIDASTQPDESGSRQLAMNLTARGVPAEPTIPAALAFLVDQRELVVNTFAEFTSEAAHQLWKRSQ